MARPPCARFVHCVQNSDLCRQPEKLRSCLLHAGLPCLICALSNPMISLLPSNYSLKHCKDAVDQIASRVVCKCTRTCCSALELKVYFKYLQTAGHLRADFLSTFDVRVLKSLLISNFQNKSRYGDPTQASCSQWLTGEDRY